MTQSVDAIYESGVLRSLRRLDGIPDRTVVRLTVVSAPGGPNSALACVGTLPAEAAAEMLATVERDFEQVSESDW